ncbi:cell division protein CrgA [Tessaracoccus sp. OS52]|uniref:cell division protein CrgA n=1 Tax=Tessaracoccus sp. OS52 TaxID=2886691 RepID=UPI001D102425|nr:cell division protein CrgA [Tessaracoccus sp. OS52]
MPESKVRSDAKKKKLARKSADVAERRADKRDVLATNRNWVPWVFIPVGLLGVLWMVVYNLAGNSLGFMRALGDWNVVIGLGLIIASFSFMTLWK